MRINVEDYFPFHFKLIGYGFIIGSFLASFSNLFAVPILLVIGVFLSTTHYGFELNQENKTYREYTWFFGYRKGTIS